MSRVKALGHFIKRSPLGRLARLERHELAWLLVGLGACLLVWAFVGLAGEVKEGDTKALDTTILRALRSANDPRRPVGPLWLEGVMLDITALGSSTILSLITVVVVGFLLLQTRYRTALAILLTTASAELVNSALKHVYLRPRPEVVPHLRDVASTSFPSGHAMESAIVFMTLGTMLMRIAQGKMTKIYCLSMAVFLTLLVGISRVYLGVHYPTDVLAGWTFGFFWASVCWLVTQQFEVRAAITQERKDSA
jgi:undecaprenyl-diphosphatase